MSVRRGNEWLILIVIALCFLAHQGNNVLMYQQRFNIDSFFFFLICPFLFPEEMLKLDIFIILFKNIILLFLNFFFL
jgi:hypothetical protein